MRRALAAVPWLSSPKAVVALGFASVALTLAFFALQELDVDVPPSVLYLTLVLAIVCAVAAVAVLVAPDRPAPPVQPLRPALQAFLTDLTSMRLGVERALNGSFADLVLPKGDQHRLHAETLTSHGRHDARHLVDQAYAEADNLHHVAGSRSPGPPNADDRALIKEFRATIQRARMQLHRDIEGLPYGQ